MAPELERFRIPVTISAIDGRTGGEGHVEFVRPPLRRRLWKAAILFAVGLVGGVLLLPIPLIHILGVVFFLALTGLAVRRFLSREVVKAASGRCPACGEPGDYFVGVGGRRLTFPIGTSCPRCHIELTLRPAPPPAGVADSR
jgi:hypothetical protein